MLSSGQQSSHCILELKECLVICLQHEGALRTELDHQLGLRLFAAFLGLCPLRGNPLRILLDVRYLAMGGGLLLCLASL